jgi:hypothetical protein
MKNKRINIDEKGFFYMNPLVVSDYCELSHIHTLSHSLTLSHTHVPSLTLTHSYI